MHEGKTSIEEGRFRRNGSWWLPKLGMEASEIDIMEIELDHKKALVVEVKRQRRNYDHKLFMSKIERLKTAFMSSHDIGTRLLKMEDM